MSTMCARFRVLLLAAVLALPGCSKDSDPAAPDGPPAGYTQPAEAVEAWADALSAKDLEQVTRLLEPAAPARTEAGFRFYPQPQDLAYIPWLEGRDSWDREDELIILGHMMDPEYVSSVNGHSVDTMVADFAVLSSTETEEGIVLATHAAFQVVWAAGTGAVCDVRFEMLMVKDAEGFYVMRSMRELPLLATSSEPGVTALSWGRLKAMYR